MVLTSGECEQSTTMCGIIDVRWKTNSVDIRVSDLMLIIWDYLMDRFTRQRHVTTTDQNAGNSRVV